MTTKQEIIDFIQQNKYYGIAHNEANWLEKMIENLKPEIIKAKELVWEESKTEIVTQTISAGYGIGNFVIQKPNIAVPNIKLFFRKTYSGGIKDIWIPDKFEDFQAAKDHVQKLWDEYVLSLVEVRDEN